MIRQLYIILLALHPAQFRYRFAFEMLAIFDEASGSGSTLPLFADGFLSLVRQWLHPYRPVAVAVPSDGAGGPVFHLLDTSLPKQRHIMTGAVLSLVLFTAVTTMIGQGGRSPGILIGAIHPRLSFLGVAWNSIKPSQPTTVIKMKPAPSERLRGPLLTTLYPFFTLGVVAFLCDRDANLSLSAAEMAGCPAVLRTLDRDHDGSLSQKETYLGFAILDADRNRVISLAEIDRCTAMLRTFDVNHDGTLSPQEIVSAVFAAGVKGNRE